ncbi:pentatricopeptide repeat-containing protein At2g13600-like [Impatiens glandulifera]|uniref:pentatricopeptide repeat-containing protein At2g13600-like n=1 Tax=Impatiens glandulifera TaxID=253017 RepID=UPI001FB0DEA8|nr:pentatricopeptide repeat-containing protein At2g13600-like [Impatiens glandulifera]
MPHERFISLLHQCSKSKDFLRGIHIHSTLVKNGMLSNLLISNHLINVYAKCGKVDNAKKVFDEMPHRNLVSWSALLSGYVQAGEPLLAIDLFSRLKMQPNEFVLSSVISACATLVFSLQGQQVHALSVKLGYSSVSFVSNSLITMYMKSGQSNDALLVFSQASCLNTVSYNAVIAGLVENKLPDKGFEVFKQMRKQGFLPDYFTFVGLLANCTSSNYSQIGMELHCEMIKFKLDRTTFIGNTLVTMYSKFDMIEAKKAFMMIEEKDIISWNTLITAYSSFDNHAMALSIFVRMIGFENLEPDAFTYSAALAACVGLSSVRQGKEIHAYLLRMEIAQDIGVGNALINMYAKCGFVEYAYTVFCQMGCRDIVTWNSIIAGLGYHGFVGKSLELFEKMKRIGLQPDSITFLGVLAACNHAGFVNEGRDYFNSMVKMTGIAPSVEHISCLIDLLARAGKINEAVDYVERFSFGDNPIVLGSLLSACRLHDDVLIGERLGGKLMKVEHGSTSPFALLSNLYALDGMWDSVASERKKLKESGLKKEAGYSSIETMGIANKFTINDYSHSRMDEILYMLRILNWEVVGTFVL